MTLKHLLASLALIIPLTVTAATRYVGGDISLLPEYEKAGAKYLDHDGKPITSLLPWLHDCGMNAMRMRLFVDPEAYTGPDRDPNACQSLDYIIPLCRRIKDDGFALILDFHYSDTWADPAKQWTPAAWTGLSDSELYDKIHEYTAGVLTRLRQEGIVPDFIQPGNEISFGMLWGTPDTPESGLKKALMGNNANWDRLTTLLRRAIAACREVCPDARIILHTERVGDDAVMRNFYTRMKSAEVDYDIIGLSYYPYFHGSLATLASSLDMLTRDFSDKQIMIVETGYAYKWEVPGTTHDFSGTWPYSDAGQDKFAHELVDTLRRYDAVTGLFWWWMEYNAYGTTLSGWYNAPLFDSTDGRACAALTTICSFADGAGSAVSIDADKTPHDVWHDLTGRRVNNPPTPGVYINNGRKVLIK